MAQDSLAQVAAFGHKLGLSLQTFLEGSSDTGKKENILLTILHVNSTASSLLQIQEVLDKDRDVASPIFREAGRREIDRLAAHCKRIYLAIIIVLHKAAESHEKEKGELELPTDGSNDVSLNIAKLGVRRGLDLSWLKPRMRQLMRELQQVKSDLFLLLLLGTIAQYQLRPSTRAQGSFEEEQALRSLAQTVAKRRARYSRKVAENRSKAFKAAKEASEAAKAVDDDAKSVATSTATAVEPHTPGQATETNIDAPAKPPLAWSTKKVGPDIEDPKNGTIQRFLSELEPDAPQPKVLADTGAKEKAPEDKISEKTEEEEKDAKDASVDKPNGEPSSTQGRESIMPSWIRQILPSKPQVDWEKEDLEAVLLELTVSFESKPKQKLTKLEMDDETVKSAVAKLTSRSRFRRRPRLLEQYRLLDPRVRRQVDAAITKVKQWNSRSKEWVAIEVVEDVAQRGRSPTLDVSIMLFFRLGQDVEPVRIDIGRVLLLPFEHCRTWENTQSILGKLAWNEPNRQSIQSGRYDLVHLDGTVIPQEVWTSTLRPGMDLKLKAWPPVMPPHMQPPGMFPRPPGGVPGVPFMPGLSGMPRMPATVINVGPPPPPSPAKRARAEKKVTIIKEMDELLGIETDSADVPRVRLGELLDMWTNAPDTHVEEGNESDPSDFLSFSSSSSSSSSDSDSSSGSDSCCDIAD